MVKVFQNFITAACLTAAVFLVSPSAYAQDNAADNNANSPKKEKRVDYKSPPSPELLALQNAGSSSFRSSNGQSSASNGKGPKKVKPAKKRKPREMPF